MLPGFAPDNCQNPVARSVSNSLETFNISNYLDNISVTSINPFKIPKTQKQCFKTNFKKQTSVQPLSNLQLSARHSHPPAFDQNLQPNFRSNPLYNIFLTNSSCKYHADKTLEPGAASDLEPPKRLVPRANTIPNSTAQSDFHSRPTRGCHDRKS